MSKKLKIGFVSRDDAAVIPSWSEIPMTFGGPEEAARIQVVMEDDVWLGEFVSVLAGVRIGKGSIIGTMSTVSRDIPPYSIAVGSPARVIKQFNFASGMWEKI